MRRRDVLHWLSAAAASTAGAQSAPAPPPAVLTRAIPSSNERIPLVGLGTWITFNVGNDPVGRTECTQVMRAFFDGGGKLIDSSPMYGSSQPVVGDGLSRLHAQGRVFAADKVWTSGDGVAQVEQSRRYWQLPRFDLLQVHNLLALEKQLPMLQQMKAQGRLRYVGVTTSDGRRHDEVERILRSQRLDFVQFTYNPVDREPEQRLLPLAAERGVAVIVNRPFQEGVLLKRLQRQPLPAWSVETGCRSWAQLVLKFIISHPAVTCAIPATTQVDHVRENLLSATGVMPDERMRRRIAEVVQRVG